MPTGAGTQAKQLWCPDSHNHASLTNIVCHHDNNKNKIIGFPNNPVACTHQLSIRDIAKCRICRKCVG